MASSLINRRELLAAGLGRAAIASSTIRVAAVQMTAELANVEANLAKAERLVLDACRRKAQWVVLPEFFASGMAFHPEMAKAVQATDGAPAQLLRKLARQGKSIVGGSFLAWRDGNVYNTFMLALPDGRTLRHDKDHPTFWENCYYVGGEDDGVLSTPQGNVGAALCWEFIRSKTAARLKDKVNMVVGGSCWWTARDSDPVDHPFRTRGLEMLNAAPGTLARILGVPVVHASHAGKFVGQSWPGEPTPYPSHYLGETQIVDGRGEVLARMSHQEGEGVITADVSWGLVGGAQLPIPDRFWIPEFSEGLNRQWHSALKSGHQYYLSTTLPYLQRRFARQPRKRTER